MKYEGRMAWRANGVTARNPHRFGTPEWLQWDEGYSGAMWDARHAALNEAAAYHALSVRDNAKDREWAEKLAARLA